MFRILGIISLISLQGIAYSYQCDYRMLRDSTRFYSDEITQSNSWGLGIKEIKEDLNFLSTNHVNNNIHEKYKQEDFKSLSQRSLSLDPTGESLKGFIKDCQAIYDSGSPEQQQAVYMLLYDVTTELKRYLDRNEEVAAILNKHKSVLSVPPKMPIHKETQAAPPNIQPKNIHPAKRIDSKGKDYHIPEKVY